MATGNNEVLTFIARAYEKKVGDAVLGNIPFYYFLVEKNRTENYNGGYTVNPAVMFQDTGTLSRPLHADPFDITVRPTHRSPHYTPKQMVVTISVTGLEKRMNKGDGMVLDITRQRTNAAMDEMMNAVDHDLLADGTQFPGKQISGLAAHIKLTNTANDIVGGIDKTQAGWGNVVYNNGTEETGANVLKFLNELWVDTCRNDDKFGIVVGGRNLWLSYQTKTWKAGVPCSPRKRTCSSQRLITGVVL